MNRRRLNGSNSSHSDTGVAVEIGFNLRCVEESIATYLAESGSQTPFSVIASGVGNLLIRRSEVREGMGSVHLLPGMRGSSAAGSAVPESLEMGFDTSDSRSPVGRKKAGRRLNAAARKRISLAQRKRWAKYRTQNEVKRTRKAYKRTGLHWTQKPENRARVEQVLRKMQRAKRAA